MKSDVGGISSRARPDPIPNSEVKTAWANDSHTHVCAKVGGCPLYIRPVLKRQVFYYIQVQSPSPPEGRAGERLPFPDDKMPLCYTYFVIKSFSKCPPLLAYSVYYCLWF